MTGTKRLLHDLTESDGTETASGSYHTIRPLSGTEVFGTTCDCKSHAMQKHRHGDGVPSRWRTQADRAMMNVVLLLCSRHRSLPITVGKNFDLATFARRQALTSVFFYTFSVCRGPDTAPGRRTRVVQRRYGTDNGYCPRTCCLRTTIEVQNRTIQ